jgi:hypothetical protein
MNHDATVNRRAPCIRIHNTNRRVRLLINLLVWVDLLRTLPENRVLQQIDVGLLAGGRVPLDFVRVSKCVRVSSLVSAFDPGSLDEVLGIVDADGPGLGGVFALAGVCCCATDGALGRSVIVCFNGEGLVTYACAGLEINGSCEDGACKESKRDQDMKQMHFE